MSDIIKNRLKESIGYFSKITMRDGYLWKGTILRSDDELVEIELDNKGIKIFQINDIAELTVFHHSMRGGK